MNISPTAQTGSLLQIAHFSHSVQEKAEGLPFPEQKADQKAEQKAEQKANENKDKVTLSGADGQTLESVLVAAGESRSEKKEPEDSDSEQSTLRDPNRAVSPSGEVLSESEQQEVEELKRRDTEVKAHEQAHLAAAGNLAQGSVSFDFETGPDGKRYAVGGEVNIDTSAVSGDPQATLLKAQKIRRAATAPTDPSSQDRSVAAQASRMEAEARSELSQQSRDKQVEYVDENTPETNFLTSQIEQNEKNIQQTYQKIQNANVLEQQKSFVDFFI